jgi:hypothetical protein
MIRSEAVDELATLMLDAIIPRAREVSGDEIMSAALTLINRLVGVMIRLGASPSGIKDGLAQIMLQCGEEKTVVH